MENHSEISFANIFQETENLCRTFQLNFLLSEDSKEQRGKWFNLMTACMMLSKPSLGMRSIEAFGMELNSHLNKSTHQKWISAGWLISFSFSLMCYLLPWLLKFKNNSRKTYVWIPMETPLLINVCIADLIVCEIDMFFIIIFCKITFILTVLITVFFSLAINCQHCSKQMDVKWKRVGWRNSM